MLSRSFLLGLWLLGSTWTASAQEIPVVQLEVAPDELGQAHSEGALVLAASDNGKLIYLFDAEKATLAAYRESGKIWNDPVRLLDDQGNAFQPRAAALALAKSQVAIAGFDMLGLFETDGERRSLTRTLPLASDVAAVPGRGWLVALPSLAHGIRLGGGEMRDFGGDERPRLVLLDDDLDTFRTGLPAEAGSRESALAAARSLRLTSNGERIFAAEIANYRIYELDTGLRVRAIHEDSDLFFEEGQPDAPNQAEIPEDVARHLDAMPADLDKPASDREGRSYTAFNYTTVIRDIAWDEVSDRLLILLAAHGAQARPAVDLLDPATGQVAHLELRFPRGEDAELSQIVPGDGFVWVRSHAGSTPTYRFSRAAIRRALEDAREATTLADEAAAKPAPAEPPTEKDASGPSPEPEPRLTLAFPDGEIPYLLAFETVGRLAFGGRSRIDPKIQGSFTGTLQDLPATEILDRLCAMADCAWSTVGDPPTLRVQAR